jgi:predicted transcriptional regulator YdeE
MKPSFVEHGPLHVVGISTRTTNRNEGDPATARIPGLWQTYFADAIANEIPNRLDDGTVLGVYFGYASDHTGPYTLLVGQQVADANEVPEDLQYVDVPRGRYALFVCDAGTPAALAAAWNAIWTYFAAPGAECRAYTADVEVHRAGTVEIYVSVVGS